MKDADQAIDPLDDIKLVPEPSEKLLNEWVASQSGLEFASGTLN